MSMCFHCSTNHEFHERCVSGIHKGLTGAEVVERRIAPQRARLARREAFREALGSMGVEPGIAYLQALGYRGRYTEMRKLPGGMPYEQTLEDDFADLPMPPKGWRPGDPVPTTVDDDLPEPDGPEAAKAVLKKAERRTSHLSRAGGSRVVDEPAPEPTQADPALQAELERLRAQLAAMQAAKAAPETPKDEGFDKKAYQRDWARKRRAAKKDDPKPH